MLFSWIFHEFWNLNSHFMYYAQKLFMDFNFFIVYNSISKQPNSRAAFECWHMIHASGKYFVCSVYKNFHVLFKAPSKLFPMLLICLVKDSLSSNRVTEIIKSIALVMPYNRKQSTNIFNSFFFFLFIIYLFTYLFMYLFVYLFICLLIDWLIDWLID